MSFARPWVLLALPLLAALVGWARRRRPPAVRIPSLLGLGTAPALPPHQPLPPLLLEACGGLALLLALAGPQRLATVDYEQREALDIVLALDISGSMGAYDAPVGATADEAATGAQTGTLRSRLVVAKEELSRFVEARPQDRLGLLVFSQRPYLACPPTFDHEFLQRRLVDLETGLVPDGTGIAAAIVCGLDQLRESPAARRVLVLFTDGEDNVTAPLSPLQAAALAQESGVILYTVGIGGRNAFVRRPGLVRDRFAAVPSELHEELLGKLAERTGGLYLPAADARQFATALQRIDELERVPVEHLVNRYATDLSRPVLALALILLLAGLALGRTRWLTVP